MPICEHCGNEIDDEETIVIFRHWEKDIIAIFPEIPSDSDNWYHCLSYMHYGQHGGCDPHGIIYDSRPALPEEYADLKHELETCPYHYKLCVRQRATGAMASTRETEWRRQDTHIKREIKAIDSGQNQKEKNDMTITREHLLGVLAQDNEPVLGNNDLYQIAATRAAEELAANWTQTISDEQADAYRLLDLIEDVEKVTFILIEWAITIRHYVYHHHFEAKE